MTELMTLDYVTVYEVCKAFYNLSTTEFKIVELLAECGNFVGDAHDLSKRLKICYTQITPALNALDARGVIMRNTTGEKKVRMRAVALAPHWEYNLAHYKQNVEQDVVKSKRPTPSQCRCI